MGEQEDSKSNPFIVKRWGDNLKELLVLSGISNWFGGRGRGEAYRSNLADILKRKTGHSVSRLDIPNLKTGQSQSLDRTFPISRLDIHILKTGQSQSLDLTSRPDAQLIFTGTPQIQPTGASLLNRLHTEDSTDVITLLHLWHDIQMSDRMCHLHTCLPAPHPRGVIRSIWAPGIVPKDVWEMKTCRGPLSARQARSQVQVLTKALTIALTKALTEALKALTKALTNTLTEAIEALTNTLTKALTETLTKALTEALNSLTKALTKTLPKALIKVLDHILLMEKELTLHTPVNSVVNSTDSLDDVTDDVDSSILSSPPPATSRPSLSNTTLVGSPPDLLNVTVVNGSKEDAISVEQDSDTTVREPVKMSSKGSKNGVLNLDDDEDLKALLEEARQAQEKAEIELRKWKADSEQKQRIMSDEVSSLRTQLYSAQELAKEKSELVKDLQEQVKKAESFTQDVKQQILDLREQLDVERTKNRNLEKELEDAKMLLATSQQNAKQNHNETEHLKDKLKHLQEELDSEKNRRDSSRHGGLTAKSKEYQALKEECANLRKRIQAIEAEMKMSRKENLHLSSEYNKLQESYKHLESLKVKLETSEISWKCNLTDAQKDAHNTRQELEEAKKELLQLRTSCEDKSETITILQKQVTDMASDFQTLQSKSRMVSLMSSIPLLMLLFAVLMVIYPTLEALTSSLS
ncbi:hypothetical protein Btru_052593 [Bulinus truncatus]|nr:hypothetical protein Btru_052593 [Bulinus truncatus]